MGAQRRLYATENLQTLAVRDLQCMSSGVKILAPALQHFQAPRWAPANPFAAQLNDRIDEKADGFHRDDRFGCTAKLQRKHGSQTLSIDRFNQLLQEFAVIPYGAGAAPARIQQSDAVYEHPPGAHFARGFDQQTVRRPHFLLEYLRAGKDDLQLLLLLQFFQIPAESGSVPDELVGVCLKHHDQTRLIKLGDPTIDKLHPHQGLSASDYALQQDHIGPWNPAQ